MRLYEPDLVKIIVTVLINKKISTLQEQHMCNYLWVVFYIPCFIYVNLDVWINWLGSFLMNWYIIVMGNKQWFTQITYIGCVIHFRLIIRLTYSQTNIHAICIKAKTVTLILLEYLKVVKRELCLLKRPVNAN